MHFFLFYIRNVIIGRKQASSQLTENEKKLSVEQTVKTLIPCLIMQIVSYQ